MATGDRIRLKDLISMSDDEFSNLVDGADKHPHGAAMATILKLAKERRIMSPPRRPRGEKPAMTIRFLQRQIVNLQSSCDVYNKMILERDKQIARQDVELSEAADREQAQATQAEMYSSRYGTLLGVHQNKMLRLQFLEGYYHAKREIIATTSFGDKGAYSYGEELGTEARQADIAQRDGGAVGGQIRGFGANHPAPDNGRSVARETDPDFREVSGDHNRAPGWTRR